MRRIFFGLFLLASVVVAPQVAQASSGVASVWFGTLYLQQVREYASLPVYTTCSGSWSEVYIDGQAKQACVYGLGTPVRFISAFSDGSFGGYVSRGSDSQFTRLRECAGVNNCVYSSLFDTLFEPRRGSVVAYSHMSTTMQLNEELSRYELGDTSPVYHPTLPGNYTPTLTLSQNGRWLVMDDLTDAVYMLDPLRQTSRMIARVSSSDARGMYAVTNDGSAVAIVGSGRNVSFVNAQNCTADGGAGVAKCARTAQPLGILPADMRMGYFPSLSDDGTKLTLYADTTTQGLKRVVIASHKAVTSSPVEYLSLGDSYTSGEGEEDSLWYLPGTNTSSERCHVSARSYSQLAGAWWGLSTKNIACSGATMRDIVGTPDYRGQGDRIGAITDSFRQATLEGYIPGRLPQAAFVSKYQPKLISVGIGGNDAGLMSKLSACMMPGTCHWASERESVQGVAREIQALYPQYLEMFRTLATESPSSTILAVGYPQIVSEGVCVEAAGIFLDATERRFMRETISLINATMKRAAEQINAKYVDISEVYEGGQLCESSLVPAVNFLRFDGDITTTPDNFRVRIIAPESLHPTAFGHYLTAKHLSYMYPSAPTGSVCGNCASESGPGEASEYWGSSSELQAARRSVASLVTEYGELLGRQIIKLFTGEYLFAPGSSVQIGIRSDYTPIAKVTVNSEGRVSTDIQVPVLEEGYHTLSLQGVSPSGEPIEVYQLVHVTGTLDAPEVLPAEPDDVVDVADDEPESPNSEVPTAVSQANEVSYRASAEATLPRVATLPTVVAPSTQLPASIDEAGPHRDTLGVQDSSPQNGASFSWYYALLIVTGVGALGVIVHTVVRKRV